MYYMDRLYELQDLNYQAFQSKLLPTLEPDTIIGVRTPQLKLLERELRTRREEEQLLNHLPHTFFEENQLHAFYIAQIKEFDTCIQELNRFLPYVDNWATCDQLKPKVLKKHPEWLLPHIRRWIQSDHIYTRRYAIGALMSYYLDSDFKPEYLELAAGAETEAYYVKMMVAWYFATALAKQWDAAVEYIEQRRLSEWTHRKTIQKAVESYRITKEQKQYLKDRR